MAIADNNAIGRDNALLWHISEDLKFFRKTTVGSPVIMGRKTYESLPKAPLPKRVNFIITRSNTSSIPTEPDEKTPYFVAMDDVKTWLIQKREEKAEEKIAVIGGEQIYKELLPYCDYVLITKVFNKFENVDAYFPNIDFDENWEIVSASEIMEYDGNKYQYRKFKNLAPVKPEKPKTTKKSKKSS